MVVVRVPLVLSRKLASLAGTAGIIGQAQTWLIIYTRSIQVRHPAALYLAQQEWKQETASPKCLSSKVKVELLACMKSEKGKCRQPARLPERLP